jgi:poly(3-hydroxybutyrate) depolymerase
MRRTTPAMFALCLLAACGQSAKVESDASGTFDIDRNRISVSGVSAGAYMAEQFHVAHSAMVSGAALLAGGPYYCAEASLTKGLGPCMKGGNPGLYALAAYADEMAGSGQIDALDNLDDDKVWLFHGKLDEVVSADVVREIKVWYEQAAPDVQPVLVEDVEVVHGLPTIDKGVACNEMASPFLNACGYDAAGALLAELHAPLSARTTASGQLIQVDQPGFDAAQMLPNAYLYVPHSCAANERCGIHIVFHGCQQSSEFVGDTFVRDAGYNEWAESNHLLVLYPQVASSKMMPLNPRGCWDWWGYTGENYATRSGAQIASVMAMIDALSTAEN